MAGLVPAIHALLQSVSQIIPFAVGTIDQPHFPGARPMFHCLLALNGRPNVIARFEIDEALEGVAFRKSLNEGVSMLITTANKIACDADIQDAVRPIAHDVNEATRHSRI